MTASVWNAQSERRWSRPGLLTPALRLAERRLGTLGYVCASRAPDELVFVAGEPSRHWLRLAAGGAGQELTFFPWAFGYPLPADAWLAERAQHVFALLD